MRQRGGEREGGIRVATGEKAREKEGGKRERVVW